MSTTISEEQVLEAESKTKCKIDIYGRECSKCGKYYTWLNFSKASRLTTGFSPSCKTCEKEYRENNKERLKVQKAKYIEENRETVLAKKREYHHKHKDRLNVISREYYHNHEEEQRLKGKIRYAENKDRYRVSANLYRNENKEKINARKKLYRDNNKERVRELKRLSRLRNIETEKAYKTSKGYRQNRNKQRNKRYREDTNYKLSVLLRGRLKSALQAQGVRKTRATLSLTGCTLSELKIHIEQQFIEGMSWENHGLFGWHVDHIRPCSSYNLLDPQQQKECFHYTNLQPLWAEDNLKKSDTYEVNK